MTIEQEMRFHAILRLRKLGYGTRLLVAGEKRLALKVEEQRQLTDAKIERLFRQRDFNLGLAMENGVMAVDCDSPDMLNYAKDHLKIVSPVVSKTARGFHMLFRHALKEPASIMKLNGQPIDIKMTGHIVAPPSVNKEVEHQYEWLSGIVPPEELPEFIMPVGSKIGALPVAMPTMPIIADPDRIRLMDRAQKYIARIDSISGQGGDRQLFWTACALIQKFGLTFEEAFPLLVGWNETNARPPWNEKRLRYKLEQARMLKGAR